MDLRSTMTHADAQRLKRGEVNLGTSIMAVAFEGGVVIGADSRTTMGSYIANRVTDKLTHIHDRIYCCRSGSAADTQAVADVVAYHLSMFGVQQGERPSVHTAASLFNQLCYSNKDRLSAGIIVAGYDKESGGSVYNIPLGGGMFRQPWAIGGSGSTYVYGYCDATYKDNMTKDQTVEFVKNTLALAMSRDGSSGGVIRMCVITDEGVQRLFVPGNELPRFWEGSETISSQPASHLAMESEEMPAFADTYGQGASTPVILYVDGENEEIEEREYSMDVDDTFDVRPSNQYQPQSQQKGYNKVVDDMMSIDVEKIIPKDTLVIDSNILIHDLSFVTSFHDLLLRSMKPQFGIVIPETVIRELDYQKSCGNAYARAALSWLITCIKSKESVVRVEETKLDSYNDLSNDDKILLCCQQLKSQGGGVILLTNDNPLAIKVESSHSGMQAVNSNDHSRMNILRSMASQSY